MEMLVSNVSPKSHGRKPANFIPFNLIGLREKALIALNKNLFQ